MISVEEIQIEYSLDMFFTFFQYLRVYLILRLFAQYSQWNTPLAEKICTEYHCQHSASFAMKCELKERPYTIIFFMLVLSILIFGFSLRQAEL